MTLDELRARWEERRDEYVRLHAQVDAATLVEQMLGELRQVTANQSADLLTLTQAAVASGYSADHLGRLVRSGDLINYGRRHAPRVRLSDLPWGPRRRAGFRGTSNSQYDAVTDARSLRSRQRHGGKDDQEQK